MGAVFGATYRLVTKPVRAVASGADVPRRLQDAAVDAVTTPAAERTLDELFAGPLPELVGRAMGEHRVIQRVAAEALSQADLAAELGAALESEQAQEAIRTFLASPAFQQMLEHVCESPALRRALTHESLTLAGETRAAVRRRAIGADARLEAGPRRWVRRPARVTAGPTRYAGVATRGVALVIDALLATLVFVVGSALVGLVSSLVGHLRPHWLVGAIAGAAWFLVVVAYFVGFWSTIGQTPGMRIVRLRVLTRADAPPGFFRSLVRLVGLALAIIPCFLGFLPALVDDRRRALPDYLAGTVVVYDELTPHAG
jgi:uncharacterized RDD family membrane protein YckC